VILLIIVARYISVEFPLVFLRIFRSILSLKGFIMTWSGIRGGVSMLWHYRFPMILLGI